VLAIASLLHVGVILWCISETFALEMNEMLRLHKKIHGLQNIKVPLGYKAPLSLFAITLAEGIQ
jgi:hypothetical protein